MSRAPVDRVVLTARVAAIVAECAEIPPDVLRFDESLHRYGVDSLAGVNIAYEIGLLAGRDVPSVLITEYDTVDKLTSYLMDQP